MNSYINKIGEEVKSVNIYYSTLYNMYLIDAVAEKNTYIIPVYYLEKNAKVSDWFPFESGTILTDNSFFEKMKDYYDEEYTRDLYKYSKEVMYGMGVYQRKDVESLGLKQELDEGKIKSSVLKPLKNVEGSDISAEKNVAGDASLHNSKNIVSKRLIVYGALILIIIGAEGAFLYSTRKNKK